MDKDAALTRLAQLEAETKALREIIEGPCVAPLPLPPVLTTAGWRISGSWGKFTPTPHPCNAEGNNFFPDQVTAQAYADAFDVAISLRRQPGCDATPFGPGFIIRVNRVGALAIAHYQHLEANPRITPLFRTSELVEAAVEAVGKDRVVAAIKLFSNFK